MISTSIALASMSSLPRHAQRMRCLRRQESLRRGMNSDCAFTCLANSANDAVHDDEVSTLPEHTKDHIPEECVHKHRTAEP